MLADGLGTFFSSVDAEDRKPVRLPLAVWPTALSGSPHRSCDCLLLSAHCLVTSAFCPSWSKALSILSGSNDGLKYLGPQRRCSLNGSSKIH